VGHCGGASVSKSDTEAAQKYIKLPSGWNRHWETRFSGAKTVASWIFVSPSDSIIPDRLLNLGLR
jgi:hypothetical protein